MLTLVACTAAPVDSADPGPILDSAPVDSAPPEIPDPSFDALDVLSEVDDLLDGGFPDAHSALFDWVSAFVGVEVGDTCPALSGQFSINAPFNGCTADDGRTWAGYAVYSALPDDEPALYQLEADASITGTDGLTFLAAGNAVQEIYADGRYSSYVVGTWGGSALDDWTGPQPSVGLWIDGDTTEASLYGGLSLQQHALYIPGLRWDESCPGGEGELRVRDPSGEWYAVTLACNGCGQLTYAGTDLGEVCFDWAEALDTLATAARTP